MSTTTAASAELSIQARQAVAKSQGYWAGVWKRLRRDPVAIVCGSVLLIMLCVILLAPWITPHDPYQGSMIRRLRPMGTPNYPLGTD
ncbi:MAG: Dipeptide transport system permease protein DppC, partial [Rubritepida sp.]|nr:Dipeptide transport system permease protein DppC [Rubritepida sp.]